MAVSVGRRDAGLHDLRVEAAIRKHSLYLTLFGHHLSVRYTQCSVRCTTAP